MAMTREERAKKLGGKGRNITIRLAENEADIDALVELGELLHAEDVHSRHPYSRERVKSLGMQVIGEGRNNHALIMAEKNGELIGMLWGQLSKLYFSEDIAASAVIFYVKPEWRNSLAAVKMLHGFQRWAKAGKACSISVHVTSKIKLKQSDRLLKRAGYRHTGGNYVFG